MLPCNDFIRFSAKQFHCRIGGRVTELAVLCLDSLFLKSETSRHPVTKPVPILAGLLDSASILSDRERAYKAKPWGRAL